MRNWALIPARAGSQRVKNKNLRILGGYHLIEWTILPTLRCNFDKVIVCTNSCVISEVAMMHGVDVFRRSHSNCESNSADIEWIDELFTYFKDDLPDIFTILRPTSPFRSPELILDAINKFDDSGCDSLRAVEKCSISPYKMWKIKQNQLIPFKKKTISQKGYQIPAHSYPTQHSADIYKQNACIEVSYTSNVTKMKSITGNSIYPYIMEDTYQGLDINTEEDYKFAEFLIERGEIPKIIYSLPSKGGDLLNK